MKINLKNILKNKLKEVLTTSGLYIHPTVGLLHKNLNIPIKEINRLKRFNNNVSESILFNKRIKIGNSFWHLHSLNEIFIDEVYKFKSKKINPFIIDCGSNIGLSILYFKLLYPEAEVLGFEADPEIYKMMKFNIDQFGLKNVILNNKAVWIEEGEIKFNATGALGGALEFGDKYDLQDTNKILVESVRLRNILINQKVDFLKIDVEGAEFEILDDCLDVLHNVENIFIEYHRPKNSALHVGDFISKLENVGYKIYIKEAWNNLPQPYCYDAFNPMYDLQLNIFGFKN